MKITESFEGFRRTCQNLDYKIGSVAQSNVLESRHQIRFVALDINLDQNAFGGSKEIVKLASADSADCGF